MGLGLSLARFGLSSPRPTEPSHVPGAIGLSNAEANSSIRFSFGRFTTGNEVEEPARLAIRSLESAQESVEPAPNIRG